MNSITDGYPNIDNRFVVNKKIVFGICLVFSFFLFGLGFRIVYQPDIYGRVSAVTGEALLKTLSNGDGRCLTYIILLLFHRGSFVFFYYLSLITGILLVSLATFRFAVLLITEFESCKGTEYKTVQIVFVSLLACITIANLFSSEFFLYIDMTIAFTLGILCSTEAAVRFIRSCSQNMIRFNPVILIMLLIEVFLYETISSLFVVITLPFIVYYAVSFIDFIKKQVMAGVYYSIPLLAKTYFTKLIVNSSRAQLDKPSFTESAEFYAPKSSTPKAFIIDRIAFGMWGYAGLCVVVISLILVFVIVYKKYMEILKGIYMVTVISVVSLFPFLLRLTNDYKPRIYYPLGAMFGVICIYGVLIGAFNLPSEKKAVKRVFVTSVVGMVCIQWLSFVQMYDEAYITNYEDKYISEMIGACIDKYEEESGNKIEYVVFYDDSTRTKYSVKGWCLTQRGYSAWNERSVLNMYLKRDYKNGMTDNNLADYFHERDWDIFSPDQVVFIEDTAHICKY